MVVEEEEVVVVDEEEVEEGSTGDSPGMTPDIPSRSLCSPILLDAESPSLYFAGKVLPHQTKHSYCFLVLLLAFLFPSALPSVSFICFLK